MKPLLAQSLANILHSWQEEREELISLLQPGLSSEEIEQQCSKLPFHLPREAYSLYQWRDGILVPNFYFLDFNIDFLPQFRFLSLAEAVNQYQEVEEFRQEYRSFAKNCPSHSDEHCQKPWFPIFDGNESGYLVVLGDENLQECSPILNICWKSDEIVKLEYHNLTQMMSVIAECYETGAYYLEVEMIDRHVVEFLVENRHKVAQIKRKHNLEKLGVRLKKHLRRMR